MSQGGSETLQSAMPLCSTFKTCSLQVLGKKATFVHSWHCLNFYRPQRSCEGYVFTPVCHSVHRMGLPQCMLGYTPSWEQTLPLPGSRPPGSSRHPPGADTPLWADPPHPADGYCCRQLLLRMVCILQECILVEHSFGMSTGRNA